MTDSSRWGLLCLVVALMVGVLDAIAVSAANVMPVVLCLLVLGLALIVIGTRHQRPGVATERTAEEKHGR